MVRVCDAIMGSGKTESAISYMNAHPDKKYIYVTPYLEEAARIKEGCPDLNFYEPEASYLHQFKKTVHAALLIDQGLNITTTHQAVSLYPPSMIDSIRTQGYTLIIDEELQVLKEIDRRDLKFSQGDLDALVDGGYIHYDGDMYTATGKEYTGERCRHLMHLVRSHSILRFSREDASFKYYWMFPAEFINAFEDVFLLTYMFDGQDMKAFLDANHIAYKKISTKYSPDTGYEFDMDMSSGWMPEYTKHLKERIHIEDDYKLNLIGKDFYAVSKNWFENNKHAAQVKQLKNNVYNFFYNRHRTDGAAARMYGTYTTGKNKLRGKGYTNGYVVFNSKATNQYRDKTVLAYCVNLFQDRAKLRYLRSIGFEPSDDLYALSCMTQWIWRSAIRQGKDIYIYIPSKRMRNLLIEWIDSFSKGGDAHES